MEVAYWVSILARTEVRALQMIVSADSRSIQFESPPAPRCERYGVLIHAGIFGE